MASPRLPAEVRHPARVDPAAHRSSRGQQTRLGVSSRPFDSPHRGKARKSVPCSVAINQLRRMKMIPRNTICLWFDGTALEAATLYDEPFPDSAVGAVHRAPGDFSSGTQGDVMTVEFTVAGNHCKTGRATRGERVGQY